MLRDLVLLLRHQRKRNTIVNSRTSGKNHTTGYSQVRWEMIWHFALCVVPTSVLLQGDCMILIDTQRPVYTRKQSLLLTKPPNCTSLCQQNQLMTRAETLFSNFVAEHNLLSFNYEVQFCAFKSDVHNLPLRRVGRGGGISPLAVPRG